MNTTAQIYAQNATSSPQNEWIPEYWPALITNHFWDVNQLPKWILWMRFIGTILIIVVGLIGNSLTVAVMMDKSMRKHTYAWYLTTLAVCDTGMLMVRFCSWINMVSLATGQKLVIHITTDAGCILAEGIPDVFQTTGAWMMATIAAERFLIVLYPFTSSRLTPKISAYIIATMFLLGILSSLYYIIHIRFVEKAHTCAVPQHIGWVTQLYLGFPMEYIPAIVIIVCNSLVIYSLSRNIDININNRNSHKARGKITGMLLLLTFSFLALTLPAWIFEGIVKRYFGTLPDSHLIPAREVIEFLYQMNYAINFFIYVISGGEVRKVLKRYLAKWSCIEVGVGKEVMTARENSSETKTSKLKSTDNMELSQHM